MHKEAPASTCTGCHTEQHSDTFQYEAYLRDILGPGTARPRVPSWATARPGTRSAAPRSRAPRTAGAAEAKKASEDLIGQTPVAAPLRS